MANRILLHSLLDQCNDVHRKDIRDIACGHLNENKLARINIEDKDNIWRSAKKEPICLRQKVQPNVFDAKKKQLPPITTRGNASKSRLQNVEHTQDAPKYQGGNEHIYYPETMVPSANLDVPFLREFHPNHRLFATKHEQYQQLKKTKGRLLLAESELPPKKNSRSDAIQSIVDDLHIKLQQLHCNDDQHVPNYAKLQIYSEAWSSLISSLEDEEAGVLASIKRDYDTYVNSLLDEPLLPQEFYSEKKANGIGKSSLNFDELSRLIKVEEGRLRLLEDQLLQELRENDDFRAEMKAKNLQSTESVDDSKQERTLHKSSEHNSKASSIALDDSNPECQVMHLHAQIEEKYAEIMKIKRLQRDEYVPQAVYQRLEQCIKDIDVDTQKLMKQNDFLEQNIEELEEELENVLVKTGCKTKNVKRMWHKVNKINLDHVTNW